MKKTVLFRTFEERDVDFIYKCKNDEKLNSMIVGQYHPFSYEEASQWVRNCIKGDRPDLKFWAICSNDEEKRIVGWVSLSNIDLNNRSACHYGLVIGDNEYRDGSAMFEAMLFSMDYAFNTLKIHRLFGDCLSEHKTTPHMINALGFTLEGVRRDTHYKNNRFYDIFEYGLLDNEYFKNVEDGKYEIKVLIKNFIKSLKSK